MNHHYMITRTADFVGAEATVHDTLVSCDSAAAAIAHLNELATSAAQPGHPHHRDVRLWDQVTRIYADGYEKFDIVPAEPGDRGALEELVTAALEYQWPAVTWRLQDTGSRVHIYWHNGPNSEDLREYLAVAGSGVVLHRRRTRAPDDLLAALAAKRAEISALDEAYQADTTAQASGYDTAKHYDSRAELVDDALGLAEEILDLAEHGHIPTTWMRVHRS